MNIRNIRELKAIAAQRLPQAQSRQRIVLIYAGLTIGLSALVTLINYVLGLRLEQATGLSNLGTRTTLSTLQTMLPMALSLFNMCLDIGYLAAMLRIARGQYTSPQTLRLGFDRFWVLLRCSIIKGLLYAAVMFLSVYLGVMVYMVSPLSHDAIEILMPYLSEMTVLDSQLVLEDAVYAQFSAAVWPAYLICGIAFCLLAAPMLYTFRMVNYVIIDKPALGAIAALRESKKMMRGNRVALLKLDVSLWWYYLLSFLAYTLCYGDVIALLVGIPLPGSADLWYFVFFGAYLAATFAMFYFLRSRVEVTYALAYDSVKPEEKQDSGVVLGNIFQM